MKPFVVPALVVLAGLATLTVLFPRFDPAAKVRLTLDRPHAIAKARLMATAYGVNTNGWDAQVVENVPAPTGPVWLVVALSTPNRKQSVKLTLDREGTVVGWHPHNVASSQPAIEEPAAPSQRVVPVKKVVKTYSNSNVTFTQSDEDARDAKISYLPIRILVAFCYSAAFCYFPVAAFRRRVHYRVPLVLAGVQIAWGLLTYVGTSSWQRALIARLTGNWNLFDHVMSNLPETGWSCLWLMIFAAAGFSIQSQGNRRKWASLELLAQGGFLNRAVGNSVAVGLMSGIGIAALPYLVAMTGIFSKASLVLRSAEVLAAPSALAAAISLSPAVPALGLFGFVYPLVAKRQRLWLRWTLFIPLGLAMVSGFVWRQPFNASSANLAVAVLLFAAYSLLYFRVDLLAVMTAMVAANAVLAPGVLLSQPSGDIRAGAVPVLLAGAIVLAVSLRSAIRGREGAEAVPDTPVADTAMTGETGRMRLSAEFEVARKAQMDALPNSAPLLEGYSLAGSCTPAQQVGGDLYDYFHMADGRLGITVADVSGKGVPAALYMMVTKGLLAAIVRESSDLAYILSQINLHLYRACKKKVFVTMAAVALDPARRRLQHARAGHNPVLWRRSSRGETVLLKPAGLGLGMAASQSFSRILKIEELELEPGDAIVLYSDGITEAVDSKMDQYGEERLIRALEGADGQPAEESRAAILRDMAEFVGSTPPRDDVTLVVLRVAPEFAVA